MTPAAVKKVALAIPGLEESTSYGTVAFKWKKKLVARIHQDGESVVVAVHPLERELLLAADPAVFFLTDHYRDYPWVLIRLATVRPAQIKKALEEATAFVRGGKGR